MHIKLEVEYLGTGFFGFQIQPNKRTVQGELEKTLSKYFRTEIKVVAAGRTDGGVHAFGQTVSFLYVNDKIPDKDWLYKFTNSINSFLPDDMSVKNAEIKDKFNARQEAKSKTYVYKCYVSPHRSATRDPFYLQLYKMPNIEIMRSEAKKFEGSHDFSKFTTEIENKNPRRTIYNFDIEVRGDEILFIIKGRSFLKRMVRMLVGHLLNIALSKSSNCPNTAPAKGLVLQLVEY
ncbi:MAG: tRNA pseudouridine(38-40) synthase TruA [Christensenellaceae bacterium]|jgi:tRNA pseudouridine38-40 synthase|nr:tRNA pseudouridine(38-40) synthase TruA [Christensenellaceae bacterium]